MSRPARAGAAIAALVHVAVASVGVDARADPPARSGATGATAQAQFDYGVAEMEAGRYDTGCPALAESYRIDPHPGALFTLAECENHWGRLASALTHYDAYLDLYRHMSAAQKANQRGRDRVSAAQRDRLTTEVPRLAVALPADAPPGTTVARDGAPLAEPSLGAPLPVDPGEHAIVTRAPGERPVELRITLHAGERRDVVVRWRPDAVRAEAAPAQGRAPAVAATAPRAESGGAPLPPSRAVAAAGPLERAAGWVAAGGIAAVAVGAAAGLVVLGDRTTIDAHCGPDRTCDPRGLRAADDAAAWGAASTVAFAAGGAGVVTGAVLWLLSRSRRASPRAAAGGALEGLAFVARHRPVVAPAADFSAHAAFFGLRATW